MDRATSQAIVEQFWATMARNDFRAAGHLLHDDFVLEWPQSGERIQGRAHFVAVTETYPATGPWQVTRHRRVAEGGTVVTAVTVTDGCDGRERCRRKKGAPRARRDQPATRGTYAGMAGHCWRGYGLAAWYRYAAILAPLRRG